MIQKLLLPCFTSKWDKVIYFLLLAVLMSIDGVSQKNDYIWDIGNVGHPNEPSDTSYFNRTTFDFNYDPVMISFDWQRRKIDVIGSNSSISTDDGKLLAFTNRTYIVDGDYKVMVQGDTIFKDELWDIFYPLGVSTPQSVLILPWPDHPDSLVVLAPKYSAALDGSQFLWICVVDLHNAEGQAEVVVKDKIVRLKNTELGHLTAVRHANGRDWWVVLKGAYGQKIHQYFLSPEGIKYYSEQTFTMSKAPTRGQAYFSPDGTKYALIESRVFEGPIHVNLLDFDRCTGMLSNHRRDTIPIHLNDLGAGLSFSYDSKYLYASGDTILYQYSTIGSLIESKYELARFDGYTPRIFPTFFGYWAHGPDGKLYCATSTSSTYLHVIDYPDEEGEACQFRQHGIKIRNNYQSIPNFPHYRLGPLDGSDCDTLGLNNYPVAKYRYEADTLNHRRIRFTDLSYYRPETWDWDFDDGETFEGRKPYWHEFPADGIYEVCLRVSNENGADTVCRTLYIGTTSIADEEDIQPDRVSVYPNPTDGPLLMTLSDYVPQEGYIQVYDMAGRQVHQSRIYYGWNNVDLTALASGTYVYKVVDGAKVIGEGKVLKVE